jgi:hypothetical protein
MTGNALAIIKTPFPRELMDMVTAVHARAGQWPSMEAAIDEITRAIDRAGPLARWLKAAARKATFEEISMAVGVLVGATSIGNKGEIFVHALIADIAEREPSIYALDNGTKHVRQNEEFVSIPKVLEAIANAEEKLDDLCYKLKSLPRKLAYYRECLERPPPPTAEHIEQRAQEEQRRRLEASGNFKPNWYALHGEQPCAIRHSLDRVFTDDELVEFWDANRTKLIARHYGLGEELPF